MKKSTTISLTVLLFLCWILMPSSFAMQGRAYSGFPSGANDSDTVITDSGKFTKSVRDTISFTPSGNKTGTRGNLEPDEPIEPDEPDEPGVPIDPDDPTLPVDTMPIHNGAHSMVYQPDYSSTSSKEVGSPDVSLDVSPTGAATGTISIDVPKGIRGLQPNVAITYNSQSGNGIVGWGCNLSCVSAITRVPKDLHHDGISKGITWGNDDAYSLDGNRLLLESGSAGTIGAVYSLEGDPFTKVTVVEGILSGDIGFSVVTPEGTTMEYKMTQGFYDNGNYVTATWYLSNVTDVDGNMMYYNYTYDNYAQYPSSISYGGNTVSFTYEDRNDILPFRLKNVAGSVRKRLKTITTGTANETYRTYDLTYNTTSDQSGMKYSRLVSVTEKNGSGESLNPVTLNWNYLPGTSQTVSMPTVNLKHTNHLEVFTDSTFTAADVNGDGISDIIQIVPANIASQGSKTLVYVHKSQVSANGSITYASPVRCVFKPECKIKDWSDRHLGLSIVDIDGDGINDIVLPYTTILNDNGYKKYGLEYVLGRTVAAGYNDIGSKPKAGPLSNYSKPPFYTSSDFNCDGKTEFVFLESGKSGSYYKFHYIYHTYTFVDSLHEGILDMDLPADPRKLIPGDFNNDGMSDLMVLYDNGYRIFFNNGGARDAMPFSNSNVRTGTDFHNERNITTGDFNGDGVVDLLYNENEDKDWYFLLCNGDGTFTKILAMDEYDLYDEHTSKDDDKTSLLVCDLNHDTRSDVIIHKATYYKHNQLFGHSWEFSKTKTAWLYSTGESLVEIRQATSNLEEDANPGWITIGDFTGDGQTQLMNFGNNCYSGTNASGSPQLRTYRPGGMSASSGRVTSVTDGFGNTTGITYKSLANGNVYTKGSGSEYPMADISAALPVVSSVTTSDGAAGSKSISYTYGGLKAHLRGKGLLGFSGMTVTDNTLGKTVHTELGNWETDTFFIPRRTTVTTTQGGMTSTSESISAITSYAHGNYRVWPVCKTDTDIYDSVTTTTYTFDTSLGVPLTERTEYGSSDMYRQTVYSEYVPRGNRQLPTYVTVTQKHEDDSSPFTDITRLTYDSDGHVSRKVEHYDSSLPLTTDYTYDYYGNVASETVSGSGVQSLTKSYYYAGGRNLTNYSTTPSSIIKSYTYDTWGNLLTETEYRGSLQLTTTNTYDSWGNPVTSTTPDGITTTVTTGWGSSASKRYYKIEETEGQPWLKTWFDARGREVATESVGPDHIKVNTTTNYNSKGLVTQKESEEGNLTTMTSYTYDNLGRVISESSSTGKLVTYSYGDRQVTTTTGNRTYTKVYDAWDNIKTSTDALNNNVEYTYYSNGKPATVSTGNTTVTMGYDDVGNQTSLDDPDAGETTYTYDALGRVTSQEDARGKTTSTTYDVFGRTASETVDGVTTSYTYGTTGNEMMRLTREETGGCRTDYTHDTYGRILTETRPIPGESALTFSYTYDSDGNLSEVTYPGNVTVEYTYDEHGNRTACTVDTTTVWSLLYHDALKTKSYLGNQSLLRLVEHDSRGFLSAQKMYTATHRVDSMDFCFDGQTGNLLSRTGMTDQEENFEYDQLDRLIGVTVDEQPVLSVDYAGNGNITGKSGLGGYSYDSTHPHAVAEVENSASIIGSDNQYIEYNAYGKISYIEEGDYATAFTYGPDRERWKSVLTNGGNTVRTVIYAEDYERITENGVTRHYYYLNGGAVLVRRDNMPDSIYYICDDHLGSVRKIITTTGQRVFEATYDAWGRQTVTRNDIDFLRGYTGHEMMPEYGLINMNGRLYDPIVGRFLSPDNYVQLPDFSQNFNRYSYCLNNPLKYTDPSGEWFGFDDLIVSGVSFLTGYVAHGLKSGNWGWSSVKNGLESSFSSWLGYNTMNVSSLGSFLVKSNINTVVNTFMPSAYIPINDHFSLSLSPSLGLGQGGLNYGVNMGIIYHNGDFSIGTTLGLTNYNLGASVSLGYKDFYIGHGLSYYGSNSTNLGSQVVGTYSIGYEDFSFSISNDNKSFSHISDSKGENHDRWRSSAVELSWGNFSIGTYVLTNNGKKDSKDHTTETKSIILGLNKAKKAWVNGKVYSAPFWVGYRHGNQILRVGYSSKYVQALTQNFVHHYLVHTPDFTDYRTMYQGLYMYSGYYNRFSLFDY